MEETLWEINLFDETSTTSAAVAPTTRHNPTRHYDRYGFLLTDVQQNELSSYISRHPLRYHQRVVRWEQMLASDALWEQYGDFPLSLLPKGVGGGAISPVLREIRLDIERTFVSNRIFNAEGGGMKSDLETVLHAYALRNPEVGYCQGMNFLVGWMLLMFTAEVPNCLSRERVCRVFWMLTSIIERDKYHKGYYVKNSKMYALKCDCLIMRRLLRSFIPEVHERIKWFARAPIITVLCASWFLTICVDSMPSEALLRVWDAYCSEGRVALFRIGIATLQFASPDILSSSDLQIVSVVRTCAKTLSMVDAILKEATDTKMRERITPKLVKDMKGEIARQVVQSCETGNVAWRDCDCMGGMPRPACVIS